MGSLMAAFVLALVLVSQDAEAASAWALIEPASADPEASMWDRLWHRWRYGNGWVVNHFFPSAEACRTVEERWAVEARKIMQSQPLSLRETSRAADLISSRCVPAEALSLFNVRPGSDFLRYADE